MVGMTGELLIDPEMEFDDWESEDTDLIAISTSKSDDTIDDDKLTKEVYSEISDNKRMKFYADPVKQKAILYLK